ncbi:uncharacterized protein LOC128739661 [Sabethes cyaneus]|uniref:uncharacterized protein LOC128739661 n=1 Tax=Sabethes cyaneus TaxID=53552 RepID=UPI00237D66B2|nr:uncharacterized protein LOC128739661 [Sabethes cyaneus]
MHNVLLGVFRTLLKLWTESSNKAYSLPITAKQEIDRRINCVKRQICSDFVRSPRPLTELKFYKATELRLMLLYLGPFLFHSVVKQPYYNHFLLLVSAIRILCHPTWHKTQNAKAKSLLQLFGQQFKNYYGEQYYVYNFHLCSEHLSDDCLLHGNLDAFSAFPFENYLQIMLHYIKKAPNPLQQFKNRLGEHLKFETKSKQKLFKQSGENYSIITNQYNSIISDHSNDRYIFANDHVYEVQNITKNRNEFKIKCKKVSDLIPLFDKELKSTTIGIFHSAKITLEPDTVVLDANGVSKVLCIQFDKIFGFIVVLHTN